MHTNVLKSAHLPPDLTPDRSCRSFVERAPEVERLRERGGIAMIDSVDRVRAPVKCRDPETWNLWGLSRR
eukprot:SAG11_NODE_37220_length_258_cov_0.616352_1_plen_69_part_01